MAPRIKRGGKRIRGADGKRTRNEDCCCVECDIVAEFSAEGGNGARAINFFDESTSSCSIVEWEWDFGDGNTSTLQDPTHSFAGNGPYTVTLTTTDDCGCTDSASHTIQFTACSCGGVSTPAMKEVVITVAPASNLMDCWCPGPTISNCTYMAGTYTLQPGLVGGSGAPGCTVFQSETSKSRCGSTGNRYPTLSFGVDTAPTPDEATVEFCFQNASSAGAPCGDTHASFSRQPVPYSCYDRVGESATLADGFCEDCVGGTVTIDAIVPAFTFT